MQTDAYHRSMDMGVGFVIRYISIALLLCPVFLRLEKFCLSILFQIPYIFFLYYVYIYITFCFIYVGTTVVDFSFGRYSGGNF